MWDRPLYRKLEMKRISVTQNEVANNIKNYIKYVQESLDVRD
jgi:hypothetical protein